MCVSPVLIQKGLNNTWSESSLCLNRLQQTRQNILWARGKRWPLETPCGILRAFLIPFPSTLQRFHDVQQLSGFFYALLIDHPL